MIGKIWIYDEVTQDGIVVGQDGQRYRFSSKDYLGSNELKIGGAVNFKIEGRWAREITLLASATMKTADAQ